MKITIVIMQNFYMVLACPVCLLEKKMKKIFFIAEAGVNHNNKIKLAYRLIDAAKLAGADAIKFQVFKTENYVSKKAPLANYQKKKILNKLISIDL